MHRSMLLLLCALVLCAGCTAIGEAPVPTQTAQNPGADVGVDVSTLPATAGPLAITGSAVYESETAFSEEPTAPVYRASIAYPLLGDAATQAAVEAWCAQLADTWCQVAQDSSYAEFFDNSLTDACLQLQCTATLRADGLLCMVLQGTMDLFGQESRPVLCSYAYHVPTARALQVQDLFTPGFESRLAVLCVDALRADPAYQNLYIHDDAVAADAAYFTAVALDDAGVTVYFAPGQVADAAAGVLTATLPYDMAGDVLNDLG